MDLVKKIVNKLLMSFDILNNKISYSQFGEDLILDYIFIDENKGFFVDVGAYDPKLLSNTAKLYARGWNGINIEPNPKAMKKFNSQRKRDVNLGVGVAAKERTLIYKQNTGLFRGADANNLFESNSNKHELNHNVVGKIKVLPLSKIFKQHNVKRDFDLLDVDVEGMDFEVLKSNNWSNWTPKCIIVEEGLSDGTKIEKFLLKKGYSKRFKAYISAFYLRNDFWIKIKNRF